MSEKEIQKLKERLCGDPKAYEKNKDVQRYEKVLLRVYGK
jgi:hypothetical protein